MATERRVERRPTNLPPDPEAQKEYLSKARDQAIEQAKRVDIKTALQRTAYDCRLSSGQLEAYCRCQYPEIHQDIAMLKAIGERQGVNLLPLLLYPQLIRDHLPTTHPPELLPWFNHIDNRERRLNAPGLVVRRLIKQGRFLVSLAGSAGRQALGMTPQPDSWPPNQEAYAIQNGRSGDLIIPEKDVDLVLWRPNALTTEERTPGASAIMTAISADVSGIVTTSKASWSTGLEYFAACLNPDGRTYFTPEDVCVSDFHILDGITVYRPFLSPNPSGTDTTRQHPAFPDILMMLTQPSLESTRLILGMENGLVSAKPLDPFGGLKAWEGLTFSGAMYGEGDDAFPVLHYPYRKYAFARTPTGLWQVANMVRWITEGAVLYPDNPGREGHSGRLEQRLESEAGYTRSALAHLAKAQRRVLKGLGSGRGEKFCELWTETMIKACKADPYRFAITAAHRSNVDILAAVAGLEIGFKFLPGLGKRESKNPLLYKQFLRRLLVARDQGPQGLPTFMETWRQTFGESPNPNRLFRPAFAGNG
jgi:hypothetical protein